MTEGAQYKHFSEVLQRLKGQRLLRVPRAILKLSVALQPLLGRRIIRVLSVGKELFFVFEEPGRPGQDGQALKIHFGDGPGYQYEANGEIWGMVRKLQGPRGRVAETELCFEACIFRLWEDHNFFSHIYEVVDFGYLHAVEARKHRDIAAETFPTCVDETVAALKNKDAFKDSYVADAIMDQTLVPGVGNIIKTEGLFAASIHPLRRCRDLKLVELRSLMEQLNSFALSWYGLCKQTREGAPFTPGSQSFSQTPEKRCYGRTECSRCGKEVFCIKVGVRQRITYFCNDCQPPAFSAEQPVRRSHKHELHFKLPNCKCQLPAKMMHVYRYGADHGRAFFGCSKPPGCRCNFRKYFSEVVKTMPLCRCREPKRMIARRVMGLIDNGRYFAQCRSKECKFRVWLVADMQQGKQISTAKRDDSEVSCSRRWHRSSRSGLDKTTSVQNACALQSQLEENNPGSKLGLFVKRASTGEFVHGRQGMAQLSNHFLGVPKTKVMATSPNGSGSSTPVTSGAEALLEDEDHPQTPPPDLTILWSKRWARPKEREASLAFPAEQSLNSSLEAVQLLEIADAADAAERLKDVSSILPDAAPSLIFELLGEGLTVAEVVDCLSSHRLNSSHMSV
eukprot:TRINITY_DN40534_c0_g1_i1.p1 TRINITY_DN40534_c0_g1~~TRINITY_DN40534_c0_g1_i1.p1  ORF type:complete len:621 (+),score=104.75 TRINITY_DN40534_c0_g1_i1:83-1945(+)